MVSGRRQVPSAAWGDPSSATGSHRSAEAQTSRQQVFETEVRWGLQGRVPELGPPAAAGGWEHNWPVGVLGLT